MVTTLIDLAGVAVFAISGALAAGRKSLDLLGVIVIALVTAIGGGTLRDLLLDRHPVFWIEEPVYLIVIIVAALLTVAAARIRMPQFRWLLYADAVGLAFFTISGTRIAELAGHSGLIAVVMGTITGVFGGVLRDVLCAEIPLILRRGQIYATAAIVGASAYLLFRSLGLDAPLPALAGMVIVAALRIAAIVWDLQLPVFNLRDERGQR